MLSLAACSGGSDTGSEGGPSADGFVPEPWSDYCVGTFNRDHAVTDVFGDVIFNAKSGDQYLISDHTGGFGEDRVDLLYLTNAGPYDFDVTPLEETGELPITPSCDLDAAEKYIAAFADVSVYETEAMETKLCDIAQGTALPVEPGLPVGYSAAGEIDFSGPSTYEVYLNAFTSDCGDAESGFISVPQTTVLGTTTWLVPLRTIVRGSETP